MSASLAELTVLDASAIIAFLQGEPGSELVGQALESDRCVVGAANQAEIIAKSLDRGVDLQTLHAVLADLAYAVVDVTAEDGAHRVPLTVLEVLVSKAAR